MLTNQPFYHQSIRKMVVAFTTLFNDISIERMDDGVVDSTIKVPITVSDKAKWYHAIRQELTENPPNVSRLLPRMGVDFVGMRYDSQRAGVATTKHVYDVPVLDSSSSSTANRYTERKRSYRRVSYIYDFELSIATKTMNDSLQILEQILPYFKPDVSVTINDMNDLNIDTDISVTLKDVSKDSNRLDGFDSLGLITWTLNFELKGYIYSPVSDTGVILDTLINLYDKMPEDNPNKVADIRSETVADVEYDADDPTTYNTTITEYDYYSSSSSSG